MSADVSDTGDGGGMQIVVESLFALYPPAPPSEEEIRLEASQKAAAALKRVLLKPSHASRVSSGFYQIYI